MEPTAEAIMVLRLVAATTSTSIAPSPRVTATWVTPTGAAPAATVTRDVEMTSAEGTTDGESTPSRYGVPRERSATPDAGPRRSCHRMEGAQEAQDHRANSVDLRSSAQASRQDSVLVFATICQAPTAFDGACATGRARMVETAVR
jgi:hypothetical protein